MLLISCWMYNLKLPPYFPVSMLKAGMVIRNFIEAWQKFNQLCLKYKEKLSKIPDDMTLS